MANSRLIDGLCVGKDCDHILNNQASPNILSVEHIFQNFVIYKTKVSYLVSQFKYCKILILMSVLYG